MTRVPDEARLAGDPAAPASFEDVARRAQRRTLGTLVSTQALGGVGVARPCR